MRIRDWSSDVCSSDLKGSVNQLAGQDCAAKPEANFGCAEIDQNAAVYLIEQLEQLANAFAGNDDVRHAFCAIRPGNSDAGSKVAVRRRCLQPRLRLIRHRSEERRVWNEGVGTCKSRRSH